MIRILAAAVVCLCAVATASGQVCQIRGADGSLGSAVCVGTFDATGDAVFVTAGHCCDTESVQLAPEGRWLPGDVLAWAADGPGKDLGIVRVRGWRPRETYRLGENSPAPGVRVTLAGYPESGPFRSTACDIVSSGKGWVALSAAGVKGVSGGPLLVGRVVVGIVTHNNTRDQRAEATNAETIAATLKAWGLAPGPRDRAGYVGFGAGVQCGPFGCYRPAVPMYPRPVVPVYPIAPQPVAPEYAAPYVAPYGQPYVGAPQRPAYPGWTTPEEPAPQRPAEPARPGVDAAALDAVQERIAAGEERTAKALAELRAAIGALSLRSERGEPGPRGERGPPGPPGERGPPGNDAAADVAGLRQRIERLEASEIPVRILDSAGKTIDEKRYRLGEPLEFRLVPRAN